MVPVPPPRRRARRPDRSAPCPRSSNSIATSGSSDADAIVSGGQQLSARHLVRRLGGGPAGLCPCLWRIWPAVRHRVLPSPLGARRARSARRLPFDSHSPAAAIARAGRFVQPQGGRRIAARAASNMGCSSILPRYTRDDARLCAASRRDRARRRQSPTCGCAARTASSRRCALDDGSEIGGASVRRLHGSSRRCCARRSTSVSRIGTAGCPATGCSSPRPRPRRNRSALDARRCACRRAGAGDAESRDPHVARPRLCLGASWRSGCRGGAPARRRGAADRGAPATIRPGRPAPALAAQLRRDRRRGGRDGAARMGQPPSRPQRDRPARRDDARPRLRRGRALGL